MLNVTVAHWNNICYWGDSAIVSLRHLDSRETMGLFSSTGQPHKRCALRWTAAGGRGEGVEWRGREWSGGEGREGEGRAGQGRVPDCLGGLSRVGISSRSTRPWNGQPPSNNTIYAYRKMPREVISCWELHGACPQSCADMPRTMGNVRTRTYVYILPNIFYFWWKLYSYNVHSIHYYGYSFRMWNITILAYTVLWPWRFNP